MLGDLNRLEDSTAVALDCLENCSLYQKSITFFTQCQLRYYIMLKLSLAKPLCKRKVQAIALGFSLPEAWQTLCLRRRERDSDYPAFCTAKNI
jgi:hypothetical protein